MARGRLLPLLFLLLPALLRPAGAPVPNRQQQQQEEEEPPPPPPPGAALTCVAAAPSLAWYLDGEGGEGGGEVGGRRLARRLNCSAVDPATGHQSRATVALHVTFQPELVEASEGAAAGGPLRLVVLVVVEAAPPAHIDWVDPAGRRIANASRFVLLDARTFHTRSRHPLHLHLRLPDGPNATGLPPPRGFLDAHVELPLLALVLGAAGSLGVLVGLATLLTSVVYHRGKKSAGFPQSAQLPARDSNHLTPQGPRLPRANRSLPTNLQLNDHLPPPPEPPADALEDEEGALSEPENSLALEHRGFSRFPMVGYIYRASSVSSEEVWL